MPFISGGHIWLLLILLVVVLIVWGPGKLPEVGSGLGRAIREFRKASSDTRDEFMRSAHHDAAETHSAPGTTANPAPTAPAAAAQVMPGTPAEPVATGGGTAIARPTEHVAGEGDSTAHR